MDQCVVAKDEGKDIWFVAQFRGKERKDKTVSSLWKRYSSFNYR